MRVPKLYIIAGCNGAGKTTASYTILPEMINCKEFVNADEIARGLSPFQAEKVAIEAGRIMLNRIKNLIDQKEDFAFETTLATKSYVNYIKTAKKEGYNISLIYFWLNTPELAIERVRDRVKKGGHSIPKKVIKRRYSVGAKNLFQLYISLCDYWMIFNNSENLLEIIAEGESLTDIKISQQEAYNKMKLL